MTSDVRRVVSGFARGVGPIAAAVIIQSAGNLGFHALLGRILDPGAYGALGAVLAAMVMLAVPLGALQTAASGMVAGHGRNQPNVPPTLSRASVRRTLSRVALATALPAAVVFAFAPGLAAYFHLDSWGDAAQLAPYVVLSAVLATARGLLLGARRVGAVATSYLVSVAVRVGLGLALAVAFGVSGALLGTLVGEAVALSVTVRLLLRGRRTSAEGHDTRNSVGEPGGADTPGQLRLRAVGRAAMAVTGLFLFSTIDLFLARHHLRAEESGSYVAAATIAKTVLAVPAGIMSAVFPRLVTARPQQRGRVLLTAAAAVCGPALLGAMCLVLAPSLVLRILYGDGYAGAAGLVRTLATVAAATSAVTVLTHAALARRAWTMTVAWGGAGLEVLLIQCWHGSAAQVAGCSAAALVATLLLAVVLEGRAWLGPTPHLGPGAADLLGTAATVTTTPAGRPAC